MQIFEKSNACKKQSVKLLLEKNKNKLKSVVWEEYFGMVSPKLGKHHLSMYPSGHTVAILLPTEGICTHRKITSLNLQDTERQFLSMCICLYTLLHILSIYSVGGRPPLGYLAFLGEPPVVCSGSTFYFFQG